MAKVIRNIAIVGVVIFLAFFIFTRPEDSANAVKSFFESFGSLVRFFQTLVSKGG
ncbi:MAG: hypothetical protein FWG15_00320 [Propionibacteriaceae bacterium]|jgi:hypothetical protein|nr:hypothetical protein [Propionibacteriaceae bacterium]